MKNRSLSPNLRGAVLVCLNLLMGSTRPLRYACLAGCLSVVRRPCHCSCFAPSFHRLPSTQAARLECLEPHVPALFSMLEGVPSRLKLLLAR